MTAAEAYEAMQSFLASATTWYLTKKATKRRLARSTRFLSIVTAVLGGLIPVGASLWPDVPSAAGYVLFGVAAGLQLLDRGFSLSSGWSAHLRTALKLQEISGELAMAYSQQNSLALKDEADRWALLVKASETAWDVIGSETEAWANGHLSVAEEISVRAGAGSGSISLPEKTT
ncbi:SLATT domain-containing protein [Pseudarthrobacter sp. B4EP4b]|uniref:SLATT domain-containing protein n=1 Tax=Pseudarthrobacter sp. B4EP4b TaxID=2590664 RepID=UPI00114E9F52